MTIGVCMKGFNLAYRRAFIEFFFEFLPQLILLLALFGYMDVMIILKWLTNYKGHEGKAPSIITQMINNALNGGKVDGLPLIGSAELQQALSIKLLIIALVCIPVMLYVPPIYKFKKAQREHQAKHENVGKKKKSDALNAEEDEER